MFVYLIGTVSFLAGIAMGYRQARGKDMKVLKERLTALLIPAIGILATAVAVLGGGKLFSVNASVMGMLIGVSFTGGAMLGVVSLLPHRAR